MITTYTVFKNKLFLRVYDCTVPNFSVHDYAATAFFVDQVLMLLQVDSFSTTVFREHVAYDEHAQDHRTERVRTNCFYRLITIRL